MALRVKRATMKFPARTAAITIWVLAVATVVFAWLDARQFIHQFQTTGDNTYYLVVRVGAGLMYFGVLLAFGASVWLLGEIRDRLPKLG